LIASGRRLGRLVAGVAGVALIAWSGIDLVTSATTSPATWVGQAALVPLHFAPVGIAGFALLLCLPVVGLLGVGGTSIEAAERRAGLVGQLRFAATLQDVRAVIVVHRQLAQEHAREVPWIRIRPPRGRVLPEWRRAWHGTLRWPLARVARVVVLGAVAGAAAIGAWRGTTPLIVVSGLALAVAALDATEPLAQETDHPDRLAGVPLTPGSVYTRLLVGPAVVMLFAGVAGLAVAFGLRPEASTLGLGAAIVVTAAIASVAAAALSIVLGAPNVAAASAVGFPELATFALFLRQAVPAILAAAAFAPVIVARELAKDGKPALEPALQVCIPVLVVAAAMLAWINSRGAPKP
jgi:hypothetical protein